MKQYLVLFKDLKRSIYIDSQDEATAKQWADKQLSTWKSSSKVSITPVLAAPENKEKEQPQKAEEKPALKKKQKSNVEDKSGTKLDSVMPKEVKKTKTK